jgi:hypothetical protein
MGVSVFHPPAWDVYGHARLAWGASFSWKAGSAIILISAQTLQILNRAMMDHNFSITSFRIQDRVLYDELIFSQHRKS